mgnify:CR=1 FL=1
MIWHSVNSPSSYSMICQSVNFPCSYFKILQSVNYPSSYFMIWQSFNSSRSYFMTCKDLLPIKRWPQKLGPAILPIDYWPWQLDQPCSPIEHRSQNLVMVSHTQLLNIVKTFTGYGTAWSQGNLTPLCIDFICLNKLLFSFAR